MRASAVIPRLPSRLALCAIALFAAGCDSKPPDAGNSAPSLPFAGKQVEIVIPAATGLNELWLAPAQEWSTQTGGEARLVEYDGGNLSDLMRAVSTGEASAVAVVSTGLLLDAAATLEISPIPETALSVESGLAWSDLLPGVRDRLGAPRRKPLMVPLNAPVLVCYYREDLLKLHNLRPPQTWEEYTALVNQLPTWGPGLVAVEPWSESFRATMFLARAVSSARHPDNYSVFVDLETLQPMIDNPAYLRALEQTRDAVSKMPDSVWSLDPLDCRRLILEGKAALAIGFEPRWGSSRPDHADGIVSRAEGIEVSVCPLPGAREAYNAARQKWDSTPPRADVNRGDAPSAGGQVFRCTLTSFDGHVAVCFRKVGTGGGDVAWNAFASLAGLDYASRLPAGMAGLTRESQLSNPAQFVGPELSGTEANAYLTTVADSLRASGLVFELPFPRRADFRRALASRLTDAVRHQSEPSAVLGEVAREWQALIEEIGRENFRTAYRQILGLGAKPDSGR